MGREARTGHRLAGSRQASLGFLGTLLAIRRCTPSRQPPSVRPGPSRCHRAPSSSPDRQSLRPGSAQPAPAGTLIASSNEFSSSPLLCCSHSRFRRPIPRDRGAVDSIIDGGLPGRVRWRHAGRVRAGDRAHGCAPRCCGSSRRRAHGSRGHWGRAGAAEAGRATAQHAEQQGSRVADDDGEQHAPATAPAVSEGRPQQQGRSPVRRTLASRCAPLTSRGCGHG